MNIIGDPKQIEKWDILAKQDPYHAVCSQAGMANGKWKENLDRFYASGEKEIEELRKLILEHWPDFEWGKGDALDYGCGMGRLTRGLAKQGFMVTGADASQTMLEEARKVILSSREYPSVWLFHTSELEPEDTYSLIYCSLTLQHMSKDDTLETISLFWRLTKKGGVFAFNVPSGLLPGVEPKPMGGTHMTDVFPGDILAHLDSMPDVQSFSVPTDVIGGGHYGRLYLARRT